MYMWRVGVYLVLMLAVSLLAVAGATAPASGGASGGDKTQAEGDNPPKAEGVKGAEERAPDKDKKTESDVKSPSESDKGGPSRDFLKLAEPKSLTGKKQAPKGSKWGGYWGAVYRRSPDEEPEMGERDSEPDQPQAGASAPGGLPPPSGELKRTKPPEKPASLAEYKEVDFARLASGSYASDYGDKYVKFHCRFASLAPEGMRLQDFPPPEYLNFIVVGTGSSMENLTVVARKEMADRVFRMESGREITLYGRAHRLGLSGLTLVVEEVETNGQAPSRKK